MRTNKLVQAVLLGFVYPTFSSILIKSWPVGAPVTAPRARVGQNFGSRIGPTCRHVKRQWSSNAALRDDLSNNCRWACYICFWIYVCI